MTHTNEFEQIMNREGDPRRLEQQLLLLDAAEMISRLMQDQGVTRSELARRIGKSKGFVTQVLNGRHNMTLRTLADLATALGTRLRTQEADSFWSFATSGMDASAGTHNNRCKVICITGVAA